MSQEQNFEQIWGFRRRDDNVDSSSDDSKSNSGENRPVKKKHKAVQDLILPENDHISDPLISQQNGQLEHEKANADVPKANADVPKANADVPKEKKRSVKKKTRKTQVNVIDKQKSKQLGQPVFDEFRMFTKSIIEDLRVTRENMFGKMQKEMSKLVSSKSASRLARNKGISEPKAKRKQPGKSANAGSKAQNDNVDQLERSEASNKQSEVLERMVIPNQTIESIPSNVKGKVARPRKPKKSAGVVSKPQNDNVDPLERAEADGRQTETFDRLLNHDHTIIDKTSIGKEKVKRPRKPKKSTGAALKTQNGNVDHVEKSETNNKQTETLERLVNRNQDTEVMASNGKDKDERPNQTFKRPGVSEHPDQTISSSSPYVALNLSEHIAAQKDASLNFERGNIVVDGNAHRNYFLGIQAEDQFRSLAQVGSRSMGWYGHHGTESSCMTAGFPLQLQQRLDNSFNISSQGVSESSSKDASSIGHGINGGAMRFSDRFAPNNFHSFYRS